MSSDRATPALAAVTAGLLSFLWAAPSPAETIDATATTIVAGKQDVRDGKIYSVVPLYEHISLLATDFQLGPLENFRIMVSGWGMANFGDTNREKVAADLDLGYVEGGFLKQRIKFRLGRQFVMGGAARMMQFDGGLVEFRLFRGLGITGYGGVPVTPRFGTHRGDATAGARLFWRQSSTTEVGVSYKYVLGEGRIGREDIGIDARIAPKHWLTLTGYGVFSLRELRLAEADVQAIFIPHHMVEFGVDYLRTSPDLFLPLNSIFSVFAQETRDEAGANVFVHPIRAIRLYGDYHFVHDEMGWGHRGGGKATFTFGPGNSTTLGAEARALKLPDKGYVQLRAFGIERFAAGITFTLDADTFLLDKPINGQTLSFTGAATLGWDFADHWKAVLTGYTDVTPYVEQRFEFMAKLVYNHTLRIREVR